MFQRRRRSADKHPIDPTNPATTTLAKDVVFEGRVNTPGDVILYGTLQGDLQVGGRLLARPGSRVQGTVTGADACLQGTVDGPVHGSAKLEVSPTGAGVHLKEYSSTLEEPRADLMGLWNIWDPKVKELGLVTEQSRVLH